MAEFLLEYKVGTPHLGNLLGAIIPAIELSKNKQMIRFYLSDYIRLLK